ncbi:MAG: FtsX-like permease family protein [Oscillospiraceae bacterium]|nr:FtsX-like permease family protein [Oscillospiraceae bacterium]
MKFESLLARRYIFSQKRHSLLTICSIMIAVALMTMLFSTFTTALGITRDLLYDQAPYHVMFTDVTREQAAEIRHMNQVGSAELVEKPHGGYAVQVLFNTYIDSEETFLQNMISHIKLNAEFLPNGGYTGMDINSALMSFDQINLQGKYNTACFFAMFFIFVIFFALALRLVIDTTFEVSAKERERQFGVLQSVGATPKQIVRIVTVEGMMLCCVGVPLGIGAGLLLTFAAYKAILSTGVAENMLTPEKVEKIVHLHINPVMTVLAGVVGLAWVFFSAYGTGLRIIKMSPVEAITARAKTVKKVKKHTLLSLFFGWTGKVASRNARRNRKRFAITVLALTISMTLFATVSSITNLAERVVDQIMCGYDEFGVFMPDFSLTIDMAPDEAMQSPTAFAEGIKLLEDTGFFKNFDHIIQKRVKLHDEAVEEDKRPTVHVYYVSRTSYQRLFGEKPEISYDELTKQGGGVLLDNGRGVLPLDTKNVTADVQRCQEITREEYEKRYQAAYDKIKKEDPKRINEGAKRQITVEYTGNAHYIPNNRFDWDSDKLDGIFYEIVDETTDYKIVGSMRRGADQQKNPYDENMVTMGEKWTPLILTEDTWLSGDWEIYGISENKWSTGCVNCNLSKDEDYPAAKQFLTEHGDMFGYHPDDIDNYYFVDMYGQQKKIRSLLAAEHIGLMFILVMIALIAIVNMVNIVSTGILNRKSELAAMQCVGMTRGQMYKLAAIECLQFTLWAAIAATLLCLLLFFGTMFMMQWIEVIESRSEFVLALSEPLIKVWIASIFAFFCAIAASLIPLRKMQQEPLVEQIRSVE